METQLFLNARAVGGEVELVTDQNARECTCTNKVKHPVRMTGLEPK